MRSRSSRGRRNRGKCGSAGEVASATGAMLGSSSVIDIAEPGRDEADDRLGDVVVVVLFENKGSLELLMCSLCILNSNDICSSAGCGIDSWVGQVC